VLSNDERKKAYDEFIGNLLAASFDSKDDGEQPELG
jgi:hypothetical protein